VHFGIKLSFGGIYIEKLYRGNGKKEYI